MPKYKVVLEFKHPGGERAINKGPASWAWSELLDPECTDISITTYEERTEFKQVDYAHYAMGYKKDKVEE